MESYEALMATLALTMGASWASGINLYAALLVLGIGGSTGNIDLPPDLQVLENPMVIGAAGLMYFVEFFVDKTPGVDSGWDTLHTFVRIPAGAMLAAGAVGDVTPALEIAAGIMGGGMAATTHATKAGSRLLINTSPEPVTNWTASIAEDLMVFAGLWAALNHPFVFLILLIVFILIVAFLLPKLWRAIKLVFRKIGELLGVVEKSTEPLLATETTTATITSSDPKLAELERLQALKDKGALTAEEFEQEKQRILQRD
ncbi:hypothetical protein R50073_46440 [Maricurvus nonylphenolicus]|uniref:DUF4126 family protein n=1 Tax=Maricurvus nonylphenolicus TaxID=1008307 RepID=UPI0036F43C44